MKLNNLSRATTLAQTRGIYVSYINNLNDIIAYYETENFCVKAFNFASAHNGNLSAYAPKHLLIGLMKDSKKYYENEIDKIDKEIESL